LNNENRKTRLETSPYKVYEPRQQGYEEILNSEKQRKEENGEVQHDEAIHQPSNGEKPWDEECHPSPQTDYRQGELPQDHPHGKAYQMR